MKTTNGTKDYKIKAFNIKSPTKPMPYPQLYSIINNRFKHKYSKETNYQHNMNIIDELLFNKRTHIVAVFKDYMIADYIDEFLKREYTLPESKERLPKFAAYYLNYLIFFGLPTFCDYIPNEIIKDYGERKAELYYNKNYNNGKAEESFSNIEDEDEYDISRSKIMKTIFDSRIKDTIDNVTMFTVKHSESNVISHSNTFIKKEKKEKMMMEGSKGQCVESHDEETMTFKESRGKGGDGDYNDDTIDLISNEASLISYIRMFNKDKDKDKDKDKGNRMNNRIKVKRLSNYAPINGLSKRKHVNMDKESDVGSGTIDNSNNNYTNAPNHTLSKFKGLISATNLFIRNKKQPSSKSPFGHLNSNKSNGSNCSSLKMTNNVNGNCNGNGNANSNINDNTSKDTLGNKKNKSRNSQHSDLGFKSENIINQVNDPRFQLTKTQKIDNIISKYTIYNNSNSNSNNQNPRLFSSSSTKTKTKQSTPYNNQLKMTLKNHPLVVRQCHMNHNAAVVKSNPNFWKRKHSETHSNSNTNKEQYNNNNNNAKIRNTNSNTKKHNADDLMKIALSLLMESKKTKSAANVNININNQININANFPVKPHIDNKLSKNDSVAININSNLNNLLKTTKYSRNKSNSHCLAGNTEEEGATLASSGKGKIFSTWALDEKKHQLFKTKNPQIRFIEREGNNNNNNNNYNNYYNRPPSIDYSLKQNKPHQRQQPQIKSYISKETSSKRRPKVSFSSSNCFLQTLSKPFVATVNTKSTSSFKTQK